jgi:hypothetical protein
MQTKAKSNSIITHSVDDEGNITFHVKGAGDVTLKLARVGEANQVRAMRHGFIQRVADAAALSRNTANGQPATPEAKLAAMTRLVEHYNSGSEAWAPEREGGSGPGLDGLALAAVAEATGKSLADVVTLVTVSSKAKGVTPRVYLATLTTAGKVAPILARMRAEGSGVDADEELAGMAG